MIQGSGDSFLAGRITALQPPEGFRSGLDAVMLAAAVPAEAGDELLELGSGAGIASLCVAARVPGCRISGLEVFPELAILAERNARANELETRVSFVCADIFDLPGVFRRSFDHVFTNPPFHGPEGFASPRIERARALQDRHQLACWLTVGLKRVRAGGTFTAIIRSDRLPETLDALPMTGVVLCPLWPRAGESAKRIIVQVRKNSRRPVELHAGLVLHEQNGNYTREADAVLRSAGSLALGNLRR